MLGEVLSTTIEQDTLAYIFLINWIPVLLSVLLGGVFAGVLIPRLQRRYLKDKDKIARKIEISEELIMHFSTYRINWFRLIEISKIELERDLSLEEKSRKEEIVSERNKSRERMYMNISLAKFYFSDKVLKLLDEFSEWDQNQSVKRLDELPLPSEWELWEERFTDAIRMEI